MPSQTISTSISILPRIISIFFPSYYSISLLFCLHGATHSHTSFLFSRSPRRRRHHHLSCCFCFLRPPSVKFRILSFCILHFVNFSYNPPAIVFYCVVHLYHTMNASVLVINDTNFSVYSRHSNIKKRKRG